MLGGPVPSVHDGTPVRPVSATVRPVYAVQGEQSAQIRAKMIRNAVRSAPSAAICGTWATPVGRDGQWADGGGADGMRAVVIVIGVPVTAMR